MPEALLSINSILLSVTLRCEFEKTTGLHPEECRERYYGGRSHATITRLTRYCIKFHAILHNRAFKIDFRRHVDVNFKL